jgi:hemerythrin superfamily protein
MSVELTIHATVEEEIFYPAINERKGEDEEAGEIVNEAVEEHKIVKTLLEEISALPPEDEQFHAKVTVLIESVRHHAEEEEEDMFPYFDDLPKERQEQVSERLRLRKAELLGEVG